MSNQRHRESAPTLGSLCFVSFRKDCDCDETSSGWIAGETTVLYGTYYRSNAILAIHPSCDGCKKPWAKEE